LVYWNVVRRDQVGPGYHGRPIVFIIKTMTKEQPEYLSYLLRLWRTEGVGQAAIWRASLEDPHTGELHNFAGLEEAVNFLQAQMGVKSKPPAKGHPA